MANRFAGWMLTFLCFLTAGPLFAAAEPVKVPEAGSATGVSVAPAPTSDPFSIDAVLQLILVLGFVVALILLLAWVAKRSIGITPGGRHMKILAGLPLGAREKVVLVQVGKEQLLLGVAPGRVNLLTRFDEPVIEEQANEDTFGQRLVEAMQRRSDS